MTQDGLARLRVGHRERDTVAELLQQAAADGRLEMSELDERLETALQAKTYADLDPLVADLSVRLPWQVTPTDWPVGRLTRVDAHRPPPAGYSREDPLRLDGGVTSDKRDGHWVVPPFLRISSGAGSVRLNCLAAVAAAPIIEAEVVAGAGSVVIIVPDGWAVDDDRLGKGMGSKSIKVTRTPAPNCPALIVWGNVGLGSLKVRPGSARELRRAEEIRRR